MAIAFEAIDNELILSYSPAMGTESIRKSISTKDSFSIKHTFFVNKARLRESNKLEYDLDDTIRFCIGKIGEFYTLVDPEVLGTKHLFYFSNDIILKLTLFIAYRNISILKKIDRLVDGDFYIGGKWEEKGGISLEAFYELINTFPKTAELDKYAENRIANILKEFFPECDKYEEIYRKFIDKTTLSRLDHKPNNAAKANASIELAQFSTALLELQDMLTQSESFCESVWQEKIQNILQLLYPKYILCTREVTFKGIDSYDKRPDFLLVDANGYVDVLEIKKPSVQLLTKQASYRNNYVPVREFAGAIQQIEKYIFCLTSIEKSHKEVVCKLSNLLPVGIKPEIVSPQGILLLGRSKDFNAQQKRDFELVKRQYKNITDIMTYDDLVMRLNNIINSLKSRLKDQED